MLIVFLSSTLAARVMDAGANQSTVNEEASNTASAGASDIQV